MSSSTGTSNTSREMAMSRGRRVGLGAGWTRSVGAWSFTYARMPAGGRQLGGGRGDQHDADETGSGPEPRTRPGTGHRGSSDGRGPVGRSRRERGRGRRGGGRNAAIDQLQPDAGRGGDRRG